MPYFSDLQQIRRMLNLSDGSCGSTRYDSAIEDLQPVVEQIVLDELGLESAVETVYSEQIDVNFPVTEVALKYTPVTSVVALTIGGALQYENGGIGATGESDYMVNKDIGIIKLDPMYVTFPDGRGIVEITYKAGWAVADIPSDLKYAGNMIAVSLFNQQSHLGFRSERTAGYSYSVDSASGTFIPLMASRILSKHRRVFALGLENKKA